jgi:uncharacterized Zn finger protein
VGTDDHLRAYLASQDKDTLVDLLMGETTHNERLARRLRLKAEGASPAGINLATCLAAIDDAAEPDGFVDYQAAYGYPQGVNDVIDSLEELLSQGHAAEVTQLTEYALSVVERALHSMDDSDGYMSDIFGRLHNLHRNACEQGNPDVEALARRLFKHELSSDWEVFRGAAATYADILGEAGLAVYQQLAEAEWARVKPLQPGEDDPDRFGKRSTITEIMETLATLSGDIEELVAVKRRDLSRAYSFLEIANIYKQAGMADLALEWAERGVQAFPDRTDGRLREFLAEEYHSRGRHDEAMVPVWAEFRDAPGLRQYGNLKGHADRVGQWSSWREKAIDAMRERIARAKTQPQKDRWTRDTWGDNSELVRILLWENQVEAAWREAERGGCDDALWLKLAARREDSHPEDALAVYRGQIEPTLAEVSKEAYREVVRLLRKMRKLMLRLGRQAEFATYLESVRTSHKRKRNFMKLLDREKW